MKNIRPILLFTIVLFSFINIKAQDPIPKFPGYDIDTSFLMKVNGVEQYIEIKGASKSNPVLLFVHGGPSWPATPMIRKFNEELSKKFILVTWDQRNCGKSKTDNSATLTPDLYVNDAHVITEYLKNTYHKNKIFVVCHSWGTIIGVYLVMKYPGDYAAYIGLGQFTNPNRSEELARKYVIEQAKLVNDTATLKMINSIPFSREDGYANGFDDLIKFSMMSNKYFSNKEVASLPDPTQLYVDYSGIDWMTPVMTSGKILFNYMNAENINFFQYKEFKIPMYFFLGRYDHNTSSEVAEEYFEAIQAPKKKLYWFEHSGHSPIWEEPALFNHRVAEVAEINSDK
ncbi:MAG TPA: alpha/beta hydrolase [Puia sp.]|jgi:proline iminopeptidase|nr:alpha/beta hydrolase [Puia sp.]